MNDLDEIKGIDAAMEEVMVRDKYIKTLLEHTTIITIGRVMDDLAVEKRAGQIMFSNLDELVAEVRSRVVNRMTSGKSGVRKYEEEEVREFLTDQYLADLLIDKKRISTVCAAGELHTLFEVLEFRDHTLEEALEFREMLNGDDGLDEEDITILNELRKSNDEHIAALQKERAVQ
jgi:hypothetical protein